MRLDKGYDGLDGVELVMNRRCGASKVVDLIDLQEDGLNDVVSNELEPGVTEMMHEVLFPAREEIVNDNDAVTAGDETVNKVTSDEPCTTADNDSEGLPSEAQKHLSTSCMGMGVSGILSQGIGGE